MTTVVVPFHQDERLPGEHLPIPPGRAAVVVAPTLPDTDPWSRLVALDDAVATRVAAALTGRSPAGGPPVTVVSGDCLIAVATLAGAQRAGLDPAIVWFDAHGDLHTLESSTSGYLGGLSLRLALGAHPDRLAGPLGLRPLTEDRAVLVGTRDLDPAEVDFLATARIRRTSVTALDANDLPPGPLILHVDLDVIDDAELPGTLFPAPGGPSAAEVTAAVRRVLATGRVAVLDVACPWHPAADDDAQARRAGILNQILTA